ncbi:MAG: Asp-tRNA(Asn)/Glu-tRNA(Gln) amidotransferase subunit GatB, partial [Bacillota bacterium]
MSDFETVIGVEVHVELNTRTKIFCQCPTTFGAEPNTQVCPICLGMPGTLPVLNEAALKAAGKAALALNCRVAEKTKFDRKNYFYPDLPKGYQISQFDQPLAADGWLEFDVDGRTRRVRVRRVHLEEDAGKSLHSAADEATLVDFNRTGVPLIEIVSEPDLRSPEEARAY